MKQINFTPTIQSIRQHIKSLQSAERVLTGLNRKQGQGNRSSKTKHRSHKLSKGARKRIAQAQKARWAKWKAKKVARLKIVAGRKAA